MRPALEERPQCWQTADTLTTLITVDPRTAEQAADAYAKLLDALPVERVASTTTADVLRHRHLIRHQAGVPILVAALRARPEWLATTNTCHFSAAVASRTALRICSPKAFIVGLRR